MNKDFKVVITAVGKTYVDNSCFAYGRNDFFSTPTLCVFHSFPQAVWIKFRAPISPQKVFPHSTGNVEKLSAENL